MIQPSKDADAFRWYALRVITRAEKNVALMAREKGFDDFVPVCESRRQWSDRVKTMELPLFPGYVFCRFNPDNRLPLLTIPGVLGVVGFGRTPAPLDDDEIANLQKAVFAGLRAERCEYLNVGDRIRVDRGPLAGVEGLVVQIRNRSRLVLSVSMLNRSVAVEIERDWVTPVPVTQRIAQQSALSRSAAGDALNQFGGA